MSALTISIPMDDQTIQRYQSIPIEKQERMQQLFQFLVKGFVDTSLQSLFTLMDDISMEAEANGLTPEILDEILNEA